MTTTNKKLDQLIELMGKIALPIPAIPAIPAIPPLVPQHPDDHDLILKINVKQDNLQTTVDKIASSLPSFITREEHNEVLKVQTDHEARIRAVEKNITVVMTWGSALVVALGIIQFLVGKFVK